MRITNPRSALAGVSVIAASLAAGLTINVDNAFASSHREAPAITVMPKVDATDFYMFRSYESGREGYVTLIANYLPLQDAYGGPNYFRLDPSALYEIHIDNNGDAQEDITFGFRFTNSHQKIALNVGGQQVEIPLSQAGGIASRGDGTINVTESYSLDITRGGRRSGTREAVTDLAGGSAVFAKPVDNIGEKTFGPGQGYAQYAWQHASEINIPGCAAPGKVFVGQRKDPFMLPLGRIFDLINLNPLGAEAGGNADDLNDKNVTSLILEAPISCLTNGSEPVIGAWTTASLRQGRILNPEPAGFGDADVQGGPWAQVSRLGMPLVNEVVIGLGDKDRFNASKPANDGQFATYVTNPTLPALVELLFPSAPAPTNFPRTDLVAAFLTGLKLKDGTVVNQPVNVTPAEMLRLNTQIAPTPADRQHNLGVAGGDLAGFPNGRRPGDDVVDVSLRVAMGALCALSGADDNLNVGCTPADAAAGGAPITDGVRTDASQFYTTFPYLVAPLPGATTH
ncbi:MAG: DUF4331 domain-containing protein [Burkholderiaceae bacterium]